MRDIRADLRERIEQLSARDSDLAREHNRRMKEVEQWYEAQARFVQEERAALKSMYNIEMRRHGEEVLPAAPELPLAEFVVAEAGKRGITSKEDLRLAATRAGYFTDGETGGRPMHTTVLNLVRSGKLVEVQDGRYGVPSPDTRSGPVVQMEFAR